MATLDRSIAPALQVPEHISLGNPKQVKLDNGILAHVINIGQQEVISVELVFQAGKTWENKPGLSMVTNRMIREGSAQLGAEELAKQVDFYGANIKTKAASDNVSVTLYCLRKFLPQVLPLYSQIIKSPSFPDREWERLRATTIQGLLINREKVETIASDAFYEHIFGADHPYGYAISPEDLESISVEDMRVFYRERYHAGNAIMFVAGKVSTDDLSMINEALGQNDWNARPRDTQNELPDFHYSPRELRINKADSVQSAIRIGLPLFNKKHKDYHGMYMLNTILGGYFGSRLMSNIREDKGYTYGIQSMLVSLQSSGYMLIATEVANEHSEDTLSEVSLEFDRLKNELVGEEELALVRNFTLGNVLNQINGAFNKTAILKGLYLYGLEIAHFDRFIRDIKEIDAAEIQRLARIYLNDDLMVKVIAGN